MGHGDALSPARSSGPRLLLRILLLLAGWMVLLAALSFAALGHAGALGAIFGTGSHASLVVGFALLVAGDLVLFQVLRTDGSEASKVILGFFAVAGVFFSLFVLSEIRHLW